MRLWSLHPKYLDSIGLVALWRESLLAKKVLEGKTKGYKDHPQLIRFKNYKDSLVAINAYLYEIYKEGIRRNYKFDDKKILQIEAKGIISVSSEQIKYEFEHLLRKLRKRNKKKYRELLKIKRNEIEVNPIFKIVTGDIESWEKVKN
ncbi:MAG: pyrimidine dimer DNA glycosylase/endonuclease V [Candidatus Aenigmatarchaeota archaeon]|nr:pyrimidine dimer DNA glycosylase/endonuclease V [Candidatus Aenigmarchaeota archaeon]